MDIDSPSTNRRDNWDTSLEINKDIGDYALASITGYRLSEAADLFDDDTQRQKLSDTFTNTKVDNFSQELRLALSETKKYNWVLGGYYSD